MLHVFDVDRVIDVVDDPENVDELVELCEADIVVDVLAVDDVVRENVADALTVTDVVAVTEAELDGVGGEPKEGDALIEVEIDIEIEGVTDIGGVRDAVLLFALVLDADACSRRGAAELRIANDTLTSTSAGAASHAACGIAIVITL